MSLLDWLTIAQTVVDVALLVVLIKVLITLRTPRSPYGPIV